MTPVEQAAAIYALEPCARTFREDLEAHLLHGYVVSTPDAFVMARAVSLGWKEAEIVDPWANGIWRNPGDAPHDCWHIYLAAGKLSIFWKHLPYLLPFVSYERGNVLRVVPTDRFRRLCSTIPTPTARISTPT